MIVILDCRLVAVEAGQVTDGKPAELHSEVPERAFRCTSIAKNKLETLATYEAAEPDRNGSTLSLGRPVFKPASWSSGGLAKPGTGPAMGLQAARSARWRRAKARKNSG